MRSTGAGTSPLRASSRRAAIRTRWRATSLYPPPGALVICRPIPRWARGPMCWAWFALQGRHRVVVRARRRNSGRPVVVRVLAIPFVATLLGVLDDLWLGNVSILMAASIYLAFSSDSPWRSAIPLGLVIAALGQALPGPVPALDGGLAPRRGPRGDRDGRRAECRGIRDNWGAGDLTRLPGCAEGRDGHGPELQPGTGRHRAGAYLIPASVFVGVVYVLLLWRSRDKSFSFSSGRCWSAWSRHRTSCLTSIVPVLAAIPMFARVHPRRAAAYWPRQWHRWR